MNVLVLFGYLFVGILLVFGFIAGFIVLGTWLLSSEDELENLERFGEKL